MPIQLIQTLFKVHSNKLQQTQHITTSQHPKTSSKTARKTSNFAMIDSNIGYYAKKKKEKKMFFTIYKVPPGTCSIFLLPVCFSAGAPLPLSGGSRLLQPPRPRGRRDSSGISYTIRNIVKVKPGQPI